MAKSFWETNTNSLEPLPAPTLSSNTYTQMSKCQNVKMSKPKITKNFQLFRKILKMRPTSKSFWGMITSNFVPLARPKLSQNNYTNMWKNRFPIFQFSTFPKFKKSENRNFDNLTSVQIPTCILKTAIGSGRFGWKLWLGKTTWKLHYQFVCGMTEDAPRYSAWPAVSQITCCMWDIAGWRTRKYMAGHLK